MKNNIWGKKIPTLLGVILILFGVGLTSMLVGKQTSFLGFAAPSTTPENIRITNVSDTSFTISYTTEGKITGSISYGDTEKLDSTALDDEDSNSKDIGNKNIHLITLKSLKPKTIYYFSILSGDTTFLNNGKPFSQTTADSIVDQTNNHSFEFNGKIIFEENNLSDAIVYIDGKSIQPVATKVNKDGSYSMKLNSIRTPDLSSFAQVKNDDILNMLVLGSNTQSKILLFGNQTNPIPTVIFSKNYDFTISTNPIASSSASFGFPIQSIASASASSNPEILTPKENDKLIDTKPLFKGIASPSADIQIEIHSDEVIKTTIIADKNGNWTFRPTTQLSPGIHTVSITSRNSLGILETISQSFTVFAEGNQVSQNATPSATLTPKITPTPTKTPTPTSTPIPPTPTKTPTVTKSPTPTSTRVISPTITKTPTPTKIPVVIPTSTPIIGQQNIPQPGNPSLIPLGIAAIITALSGMFLLFLSKEKIL